MKILIMFLICTNVIAQHDPNPVPPAVATARAEEREAREEVAKIKREITLARSKEIRDRLKLLHHKNQSMRVVLGVANPNAWLRDNIITMDFAQMESLLAQFETQDSLEKTIFANEKSKRDKVKAAKSGMEGVDCSKLAGETLQNMCILLQ